MLNLFLLEILSFCLLYFIVLRNLKDDTGISISCDGSEIEKLKLSELTCRQGVIEVAKM